MKVAILGSRGFVGRNLVKYLKNKHQVTPITRDTLNLLDNTIVKDFLDKNKFDVIINCAAVMTDNQKLYDARNNFGIFMNFFNNANYYGKFINTASGAEFDRSTNIDNAKEHTIFNFMPIDSYGWGQNMKARLCALTPKFYNVRIFNCFGSDENSTRIFPKLLANNHLEVIDRYFDYFSIQDLGKLIEHCITNDWQLKDVNAVYKEKYLISEVLKKFCRLHNLTKEFTVTNVSPNNYTGSAKNIETLQINFDGLERGLNDYFTGVKNDCL